MATLDYLAEEEVELKEAIDLRDVKDPNKGAEFEIDVSKIKPPEKEVTNDYFAGEEVYKNILLVDDAVTEACDREGLDTFDVMIRTMEDVTESKDGGVYKKLMESGAGSVVPQGSLVMVHYNAYHELDAEPFDSTRLRNHPHKFRLGIDGELLGLHIAVATMKKGEKSRFIFRPQYFYGELGCGPRIPPNSTVLFDIELLSFVEREGVDDYYLMTEEEKRKVTFDFVKKVSKAEREEGNQLFNSGIFAKAIKKYGRAARILEDYHLKNEEEEKEWQKLLVKVYLNIAICSLRLKQHGQTITYCHKVLTYDPNNVKALFRKAQALHFMSNFEQAKDVYRRAQSLDSTSKDIRNAMRQLEQDIRRFKIQTEDYKKMCQRMVASSGAGDNNVTAENEGTEKEDEESEECSERFRTIVTEKLQEFHSDKDLVEMPFPDQSLTTAEIACIVEVAEELGMNVQQKGTGNASRMVVVKSKEQQFQ